MQPDATNDQRPLNILQVLRAPLGGLFRHVSDLIRGQIARGHRVGVIADSTPLGPHPEKILRDLAPELALGVTRLPIARQLGPSDLPAALKIGAIIRECEADVVHGHGAKGGAFARLCAPGHPAVRAYTPHGGSLLYKPNSLASAFYIALERILNTRTDLYLFESEFIARTFSAKVTKPRAMVRVVNNGVAEDEFAPVVANPDAADLLFIGELRDIKGIDVLINAIADLRASGVPVRAAMVGSGPSRSELEAQVARLGLADSVVFHGPKPAREAFALAKLVVVPSRAESLPYVVLEAAAAGLPLISTDVGGIPDIFGPQASRLLKPDDLQGLTQAIRRAVNDPESMKAPTAQLRERVRNEFSIERMVEGVIAGYREALRHKRG